MVKSFREIDNNLINEVCNHFEKDYNFDFLMASYPFLDYNVLYSILYSTGKYKKEIYDLLCQEYIGDSKILLISDTHYGSIYEDMRYTYDVFNFAVANGIHIILHGGDIIEANINQRKGFNSIKQANHFINRYPFDSSINTYAILGNHDYLAISTNEKVRDVLSSRNDINILGFKKAYFKWCGNTISLQHRIDNFKLNLPLYAEYISFKGHSHFYHIKDRRNGKSERICIPSLCSEEIYYRSNRTMEIENRMVKPGFLTAEIDGGNIVVINYSFAGSEIVKENEYKKVLRK